MGKSASSCNPCAQSSHFESSKNIFESASSEKSLMIQVDTTLPVSPKNVSCIMYHLKKLPKRQSLSNINLPPPPIFSSPNLPSYQPIERIMYHVSFCIITFSLPISSHIVRSFVPPPPNLARSSLACCSLFLRSGFALGSLWKRRKGEQRANQQRRHTEPLVGNESRLKLKFCNPEGATIATS